MNKADFTKKVKESLELKSLVEADKFVDKLTEVIAEVLKSGEELQLGKLGKFTSVTKAAHKCRNPRTGETIDVPEKKQVKFKVSSNLKKIVNE